MTTSKWVPIRDSFLEGISFLARFVAPIAVMATSVIGMPPFVANVLKALPSLMAAVEIAIPEPGSGPAKKQHVLDAAQALIAVGEQRFTGGAKVNFDALKPLLEVVIDNGIAAVNAYAPSIIADDPDHPANQP
jgi:hypothetical protein